MNEIISKQTPKDKVTSVVNYNEIVDDLIQ